jgi:hypothetical protein
VAERGAKPTAEEHQEIVDHAFSPPACFEVTGNEVFAARPPSLQGLHR